jgi:hypothetical protein
MAADKGSAHRTCYLQMHAHASASSRFSFGSAIQCRVVALSLDIRPPRFCPRSELSASGKNLRESRFVLGANLGGLDFAAALNMLVWRLVQSGNCRYNG